jgi:hypothetical protein
VEEGLLEFVEGGEFALVFLKVCSNTGDPLPG